MNKFKKIFAAAILVISLSAPSGLWAGSLSNYGENAWMGHLFGSAYTPASTIYLALATSDPGETATGASMNEVANSNGYARKAITFAAASSRAVAQNATVTFDQASGSWGTVTHYAIVDSGTHGAGNVLAYGAFSSSFSPVSGNTASVASGQVTVTISASSGEGFTSYLVHKMLDLMFRNTAYSQPATYIALLDSAGADTDTTLTTSGKEVAGTGSDQGHAARRRADRVGEGRRRTRDDRRPRAQRPLSRLHGRHGALAAAARGAAARRRRPPRRHGRGRAPRGRDTDGAARRSAPRRLRHGLPEDRRARPDRRARAGRPRRVDGRARPHPARTATSTSR